MFSSAFLITVFLAVIFFGGVVVSAAPYVQSPAKTAPIDEAYVNRIADAIWHAEGGNRAKVSHGILSVRTRNAAHARQVCLTTIRNTWDRWQAIGSPGDFIDYLGKRYAPVGVKNDPQGLNKNWPRNVRSRLNS